MGSPGGRDLGQRDATWENAGRRCISGAVAGEDEAHNGLGRDLTDDGAVEAAPAPLIPQQVDVRAGEALVHVAGNAVHERLGVRPLTRINQNNP